MPGSKTLKLRAALAAAALAAVTVTASNADAMIVYDPSAVAQAVKQVEQGVQQIEQLKSQLQAQMNMLQSIGTNAASVLPSINSELGSILTSASGIGYTASDVQSLLSSVYPNASAIQGLSPTDLTNALQVWHSATDASLQTALRTQQQIAQAQPTTQAAIQGALAASQSAPGQTTAIQATNQLLATVSAQLTQLQAILTTQARAAELAQQQAQADSAAALSTASQFEQSVNGGTPPTPPGVTDTSSL
jgi:P-type conjugative transfer protein TrbJ